MKRTLWSEIGGKVFTKGDIRALARIVWELYLEDAHALVVADDRGPATSYTLFDESNIKASYSIAFTDGSMVSSDTMDVFNDGEWIDLKRAERISMEFNNRIGNRKVGLFIVAGSRRISSVQVEGPGQEWVDVNYNKIQTIIKAVKPQPVWVRCCCSLVVVIAAAVSIPICLKMLLLTLIQDILPNAPNTLPYSLPWSLGIMFGPVAFALVSSQMPKLWPMIEFDFGPEHMRTARARRKAVEWAIGVVLLPVALGVITNLITP